MNGMLYVLMKREVVTPYDIKNSAHLAEQIGIFLLRGRHPPGYYSLELHENFGPTSGKMYEEQSSQFPATFTKQIRLICTLALPMKVSLIK